MQAWFFASISQHALSCSLLCHPHSDKPSNSDPCDSQVFALSITGIIIKMCQNVCSAYAPACLRLYSFFPLCSLPYPSSYCLHPFWHWCKKIGSCSEANYLMRNSAMGDSIEAPKALQASECSELLDPTRANCWISAQHQPGKFTKIKVVVQPWMQPRKQQSLVTCLGEATGRDVHRHEQTTMPDMLTQLALS